MKILMQFINSRRPWVLPAWVALATFACHLFFGVWFWTASPTRAAKSSLRVSGEEYLAQFPSWNTEHEADAAFYNRGAVEAMRTGIPRTRSGMFFEHAPLYAWFLGGCYKIGGLRLLALAIPQAVLAALTALFVGLIATRLAPRAPNLAGLVGAGLVLINIHIAGYVGTPSPTLALLCLFAFGVWALVRVESGRMPVQFVLAMGLAVYMQAAFFVVSFGIVLWALLVFWRQRDRSWLVGAVLLVGLTFSKPAVSLLIDRSKETHSTEPPTAVLWEANNPYYEDMTAFSLWERRPGNHWSKWQPTEAQTKSLNDYLARAGGHASRAAVLWIREHPGDYLELCVVRAGAVFGPITGQMSPLNRKIMTVLWLLIFPAGFYGLWRLRGTNVSGLVLMVMLAEFSFEILIIAGWQPRYRLPVDVLLCALAGITYACLLRRNASAANSSKVTAQTLPQ